MIQGSLNDSNEMPAVDDNLAIGTVKDSQFKAPNGEGMGPPDDNAGAQSEATGAPAETRKGTGPRTTLGKERSKHNARTHGIFSGVVVLKSESQAEFDALLNGLRNDFRPVGTLEESCVELLAVTRWRQRRLLIAEAAEIELGTKFFEWDDEERHRVEAREFPSVSCNGGLIRRIANVEALRACCSRLKVLKEGIETNGFNPQNDLPILTQLYGHLNDDHWQIDIFKIYKVYAGTAGVPEEIREKSKYFSPEECKNRFLKEVENEIIKLDSYLVKRGPIEQVRGNLESLCRNVPDSPRFDRLLRYSTNLERTFDRTLSQLERAQRIRLGQPVVPRIDVNVLSS
jgi:hypothetical protein